MSTAKPLSIISGGIAPAERESAARMLRETADAVESGRCEEFVLFAVVGERFDYRVYATRLRAVALTAMAHDDALRQMRDL